MGNLIRSWDIDQGRVSFLGASVLSDKDHAVFAREEVNAIRSLCEKVLASDQGSRFATDAYNKDGRLSVAVGFNGEKGLCLRVNGVEHRIIAAQEVYNGKLSVLKDIKKIQAVIERKGIGKNLAPALPVATDEKIKKIYKDFVAGRVESSEKLSLVGRIGARIDKWLGSTDPGALAKNLTTVFAPIALTAFDALALAGGALLAVTGAMLVLVKVESLAVAILHKSREKALVVFSELAAGVSAFATGALFVAGGIATLLKETLIVAAVGVALPIAALCLYTLGLISSGYKAYVGGAFQSKLNAVLGKGDAKQLSETLKWIRQKTQLSQMEIEEHKEEKDLVRRLHNKWDQFALRAGKEVFEFMQGIEKAEALDSLIARLDRGDAAAVKEAETWIHGVQEKNKAALRWYRVAVLSNLVGIAGVIIYLTTVGYIASAVVPAFFAVSAGIAIIADSSTVRSWIAKIHKRLSSGDKKKDIASTVSSISGVMALSSEQKRAIELAGSIAARLAKKYRKQDCSKSDERVEREECQIPASSTSSTSSNQNVDSHQTPSPLMGETLRLSRAS